MTQARAEASRAAKSIQGSFNELGNAAQSLLAPFGAIGGALGQSLGSIGQTMRSVTDSIGPLVKELGLVGAGMASVAGAAAALGAAGAGIALFAAKGADELYEMSEKTGVSVEALSSLGYAAKQSGVDTDALANGLERMSKSAFQAATVPSRVANAFQRMGVSVVDASGQMRSTQSILEDLSAKFSTMAEGPAKTALAMQIFGKAGADMLPLLNQGKDGIAAMTKEAQQLGLVISGQTAQGAHVFEQTLDKIEAALTGASNTVLSVMLPSMQALSDFFVNDLKDPSGIFRELGSTIGEILVPAFKLLASAIAVAVTMGDYFVAALSNGIQFVTTLVYGLGNAFNDIKTGNFREAGDELKASFQQGLADFTKGVTDETGKADARLQKFFASTWLGADFSKPETKRKADTIVDVNPQKKQQGPTLTRSKLDIPNITPPDLTQTVADFESVTESLQKLTNAAGLSKAQLQIGSDALSSFYQEWDRQNRKSADVIEQNYSEQLQKFQGLLALQLISQSEFSDVSQKLESTRLAEIQKLQAQQGTSYAASFGQMFNQIVADGDAMAAHLADAVGGALKGLTEQLTQFAMSGKANFAQVGKSFESSVIQSGLGKLQSSATKAIAGHFGIAFSGKADGSQNAPFYVKNADKADEAKQALTHKISLGNVGQDISGAFKGGFSGLGSIFKLFSGGGFGSIFGSLGSIFGGFRADGGSVSPGVSYMVGERGRERFVPATAGTIIPNALSSASGKASTISSHLHIHGVTDAGSFKASKSQILGHLANAVGRAVSRR